MQDSSYGAEWAYIPGNHWSICQRCGEKRRSSEIRKEWTNLLTCPQCWDPPIPQLFAPNVWPEGLPVPDASPRPPDIFVDPNEITPEDL